MGVIVVNFYGGGSVPLAAVNDGATYLRDVDMSDVATGSIVTFTTPSGALSATVIPSGGSGNYTYSWTLTKIQENSDPVHSNYPFFSVNTIGATNTDTLAPTIDGARGAYVGDIWDGEFLAQCTVSDGVSSVVVNIIFIVIAASF